jgi:hypothetical protein
MNSALPPVLGALVASPSSALAKVTVRNGQNRPRWFGDNRRAPRTVDRYEPFPVEALPAPLCDYVQKSAQALSCDEAFVALPVLAATASAIGNTRSIHLKDGWDEPSILWTCVVAESGSLKSPAMDKAVKILLHRQEQNVEQHNEDLAIYMEDGAEVNLNHRAQSCSCL